MTTGTNLNTKEAKKTMPYVNIRITDEGVDNEQREKLIAGATQLVVDVLNKDPQTTFVIIDEIGRQLGHCGRAGDNPSQKNETTHI